MVAYEGISSEDITNFCASFLCAEFSGDADPLRRRSAANAG
jgi:hypothetical protein